MPITILLLTLLVSYTLVFAIQEGKLPSFIDENIERLREKYDFFERLFSCSYCLGFWTGLVSYVFVHLASQGLEFTWQTFTILPLVGLASAASSYLLSQIALMGAMEDELPPELQDILDERMILQEGALQSREESIPTTNLEAYYKQERYIRSAEDSTVYFCSDCEDEECENCLDINEEEEDEDKSEYDGPSKLKH